MIHEKYTYSQYQINMLNQWKEYLKKYEPLLRERLSNIIERYSPDNRENLPPEERDIVELEFFHGSGDLNFSFIARTADWDELNVIHENDAYLIPEYEWFQPQNNDFEYPDSLDIFYEESREMRAESERWNLTFEWLVRNWMALGGHRIGILCGTLQNNAVTRFSLNFINWDDFIDLPEPKLNEMVAYPLIRDLSDYEIKSRVRIGNPPFIQKFRYFEKDTGFYEIGRYSNIVGTRCGMISDYDIIPFENKTTPFNYANIRFNQNRLIASEVDNLINQGYTEKEKPGQGVKILEEIIEWEAGYFSNDFKPIDQSSFDLFRTTLHFDIPKQYKWFIERMNNVNSMFELSNFRIGHRQWKTFDTIFKFEDLISRYNQFHSLNEVDKKLLPIANDREGGFVLIHVLSEEIYYFKDELKQTHGTFQEFIQECAYVSEYFVPMIYHLEKGNLTMLKRWISEGIDINDSKLYGNRTPIQISRNYEITEILCQHGANPNDFYLFSEMGSRFIKMLIHYGLDLKRKLQEMEWFYQVIMENDGYIEIRELLQD